VGKSLGEGGAALNGARPAADGVTIVICTRDRCLLLERTLRALEPLARRADVDVLVVDNGSSDATAEIVRETKARAPDLLRGVIEPVQGLSAARNTGLRHARGAAILFLDDDAIPSPGWLEAYEEALSEPGVLAAGGPVDPEFDGPLPEWLVPRYLPYLSAWDLGGKPFDLLYNELPRGANMAFRREAFELVGGFDRRLGRSGNSLRSCEEIELGLRLERTGARTLYVPAARVTHRVEASRLTPEWMARRFAAQGFSEAIIDWKHRGPAGLREGHARFRQAADAAADRVAPDVHAARFEGAGLGGYRRGALYALLMVERWSPSAEALASRT